MSRLLAAREDQIYDMRLAHAIIVGRADVAAGRVIYGTDALMAEMKQRHPDG